MSDDLNRLRATMSELAEHGGSTDLYQRALDGSRRLRRRRVAGATSGIALAVLAMAAPIALTQHRTAAPLPAGPAPANPTSALIPVTPTAVPNPTATTPKPSRSPASSPTAGQRTDPDSSRSPRSPDALPSHPANGCPVGASTLQKVAGLEAGYKIDRSSIKCKQNWATSEVTAPTVEQQGDGLIYFKYSVTTGKWTKKGEGSSVPCGGAMGVPASTGFCTPDA